MGLSTNQRFKTCRSGNVPRCPQTVSTTSDLADLLSQTMKEVEVRRSAMGDGVKWVMDKTIYMQLTI